MKYEEFTNVIKDFINIVSKQIDTTKGNHVYLKGVRKMVSSKMYLDVVLQDIQICERYMKGKLILDFGTGSGYIAMLLSKLGYDVIGIDIDNYEKNEDLGFIKEMTNDQTIVWSNIKNKYCSLEYKYYKKMIPYEDNYFDGVVGYAVLEHIPDDALLNAISEIKRVLKPNGYFFISRLPRKFAYIEYIAKLLRIGSHEKLYGDKEIENLLNKNGFEIVEESFTDILPAYPETLTNSLFPLLGLINKILSKTFIKYLSHDIRILCRKTNNKS